MLSSSQSDPSMLGTKNVKQFPPSQYTVGWICAIPVELEAARAILDSTHQGLRYQPYWDTNHYHLGSIDGHKIVIACLPLMGKVSAATTATNMNSTFPNLRIRLMVGIGGGIPGPQVDIRLGDVAVSKPSEQHGGVVEYDFGRWEVDEFGDPKFRRIGSMNRPPTLLLSLLPSMMSRRQLPKELSLDLHKIFIDHEDPDKSWLYPGAENDTLFQADYPHTGDRKSTCAQCHQDKSQYVARESRKNEWPKVHYGTIASGDAVVKNTKIRDWLGEHENAICVEMEAAGLMNDFPCLVVRGISDYADSHKNSMWQRHAAAIASVYSRKLLQELRSSSVIAWNPHGLNQHFDGFESIGPYFTGRRDESRELEQQLLQGRDRQEQTRIIIHGKPGVGKSEFCRRCAGKVRSFFWGVFRIDGSSEAAIKCGLANAYATAFELPSLDYETSKLWLEKLKQDWLLILENVDDASFDLSKLLPTSTRGSVIITTYNPKSIDLQTSGIFELKSLGLDDATRLLLQACQIEEKLWMENFYDAHKIIFALGNDTLGIVLAGSLVRTGFCTLKEYLVLYQKQQELPISWELQFLSNNSTESLVAFKVSEESLKRSKISECADALKLLATLAWLHFHMVPDQVFYRKAFDKSPIVAATYHLQQHQSYTSAPPSWLPLQYIGALASQEFNDQSFRQATRLLASLSFITIDAENGNISMHPLIHLWVRKHMSPDQIWPSWANTVDILAQSILLSHDHDHPLLHPHIEYCAKHRPPEIFIPESSLEVCKTLFSLGLILHRTSCDDEALATALFTFSILNKDNELCMEPIRCSVLALLAVCKDRCNDRDAAIQYFEQMLTIIKASPTFTATIPQDAIHDAKFRLARMYLETEKTTAALPLLEAVINELKSQKPLPPLLLESENELARAYLKLHQPENALELLHAVAERRQRLLGQTNVNFLRAQMISAEAYMALGKLMLAGKALLLVRESCRLSPGLDDALRVDLNWLAYKLKDMNEASKEEGSSPDEQGDSTKGIKSKI